MALRDLKHSTKPPHQYSCFEKGIFNGFGPIFVFEIERSEPRRHFTFKFQVDVGVLGVGVGKLGVSRLPYRFQSDTAISDGISGVSTGPNEVPPVHHCSSPSHPKNTDYNHNNQHHNKYHKKYHKKFHRDGDDNHSNASNDDDDDL